MDDILKLKSDTDKNESNLYITREQQQEWYDREFNRLMQKPKLELVRMLIGIRPI